MRSVGEEGTGNTGDSNYWENNFLKLLFPEKRYGVARGDLDSSKEHMMTQAGISVCLFIYHLFIHSILLNLYSTSHYIILIYIHSTH